MGLSETMASDEMTTISVALILFFGTLPSKLTSTCALDKELTSTRVLVTFRSPDAQLFVC